MPAYLIADIDVRDPERYSDYTKLTPAIIERHGGVFKVRGGRHEVTEGTWTPSRLVVIEFKDYASAEAFVNDPEYIAARAIRQEASTGSMVIVDGASRKN